MQDFKQLKVWQKSHRLALEVYRATSSFPKAELYGLASQLRRAAASISANIAEGCGRNGKADFARFIHVASGSASELECHLLLARDLGFLDSETSNRLLIDTTEVKRMLYAFASKLKATEN